MSGYSCKGVQISIHRPRLMAKENLVLVLGDTRKLIKRNFQKTEDMERYGPVMKDLCTVQVLNANGDKGQISWACPISVPEEKNFAHQSSNHIM